MHAHLPEPEYPLGAVTFAPENDLGLNCRSASTACTTVADVMPYVHTEAPSADSEHSDWTASLNSANNGTASEHLVSQHVTALLRHT